MFRSIKQLRQVDVVVTDEEIVAAARQSVRKVSGYRQPSRAKQETFDKAIADIANVTRQLLQNIA